MSEPRSAKGRDRRETLAEIAKNADVMADIFKELLRPHDGQRYELTTCRAGTMRRGVGYRYAVQYHVGLIDSVTGRSRKQLLTGVNYGPGRTRRMWDSVRAEALSPDSASDSAPFPPFAYVPEMDMLVQAFPHDYRLPALAELMAGPPPELAPPLLAQFGDTGWQIDDWRAQSIQYRVDSRATLRLKLRASQIASGRVATKTFYGRVYRDDTEARHAHETQIQLCERIEANGARFIVATPIAYSEQLRTLVQSELSGEPLLDLLRKDQGVDSSLRTAARATADLHRLDLDMHSPIRSTRPRSLPTRIARLESIRERLDSTRPDLARELADVTAAITGGLADAPIAPTHGDLKPDHFLIDQDDVGLLDFEFLAPSDPILDIVNMESEIAKAQSKAEGSNASAGTAARIFVEEYFSHAPKDGLARLPLYRALESIVETARLRRVDDEPWQDRVERSIRDAQTALNNGWRDARA